MKTMALFSGGKDSFYAVLKHPVDFLVSLNSDSGNTQFHAGPETSKRLRLAQLKMLGLPYAEIKVGMGPDYLKDLFYDLRTIVERERIECLVTGDLWHPYTNGIGDMLTAALGIKLVRPAKETCPSKEYGSRYVKEVISKGIESIVISVREKVLPKTVVGSPINSDFIKYMEERGIDVAGESGEYQSFVIAAPLSSQRIEINNYRIHLVEGKNGKERFWRMDVQDFNIEDV